MKRQNTTQRARKAAFVIPTLGIIAMLASGTAHGALVAYEPFDYSAGALGSASGGTGFSGNWSSNGTTNVVAADLTYGDLATTGGSIGNLSGAQNRFGASRTIDLATPGLLANGSELWFSLIMGYDSGGNRTNSRLAFVLGSSSMATGNNQYRMGTTGATGLGVNFGRTSNTNGTVVATSMNDANAAFGTGQGTIVVPDSDSNLNVDYRLVVGRITWGATEDTIDLFLTDTNLNLGSVHSTLTVDVDQSGYDTISFARGDKVVMDEIRFGASYADVSPIPEPSTAALAGLFLGVGLLRRRR